MKYFMLPPLLFIGLLTPCQSIFSQDSNKIETKKDSEKNRQEQLLKKIEAQNKANKETRQHLNGTILSELNLEDIDGNNYTLETLKDQVVVINFWLIHCKPCVEDISNLNILKSEFHNENVKFIAVALDNNVVLKTFLQKIKFDFTIIPNANALANNLGIPHYAFNVIIDKTGKLHYISDALSLNMMKRLKRKINKFIK